MQQHEFIWMAKNLKVDNVTQDESGNTIVKLRPHIVFMHNYKKKNQMMIMFSEDKATYIIPSKVEMEEIYEMHLTNPDVEQLLRKYCEENLEKV